MGGPSSRTIADRQTSIQVQTSAYGICNPVVYGTNRIGGNLVWFGNFNAIDKTTKTGGKGLGGSSTSTTYTYRAAAILALAEGTIAGIGAVWKDKDKTTLAALGLSLFTGSDTQPAWSFLTGYATIPNFNYDRVFGYQGSPSFVDQAINYSGTAYLAASSYELGDSATIPNHSFEVQGKLIFSAAGDALPHAVITDILTAQRYGVGFPVGNIGSLTSYQQYCQALGLFISPAYTQSRAGSDVIQELCDATNAAPVWSGGVLKIVPYGDTAVTGNGATYTPDLTPLFDLSDDDFLEREDGPVTIVRKTPADAYNRIGVQFRNRLNQYNQEVVTVEDQDAIEKYGLKVASNLTCDFICDSAIAKQVAQLALQRWLYKRNEYEFELGARYAMLEPMDIVTLTDAGLGMNRVTVRLIEVEEQDDGFRCIAEDLPIGVAAAATYAHDNGLRWQNTTAIAPLSCAAPVIFELPSETSVTGLALAVAAGETLGDAMYGGCRVWLSLDGTNYAEGGMIIGSSRYGTLTSAMAAGVRNLNPSGTLAVSMRSGGQLISGSAADMQKGTTRLIVGDEYLSYQTATLTGANAYTLSNLNRGLYRTSPSAKASGTTWVRVDDLVAQLADITPAMIGQTVYIKLTAFNVYRAAEESLASVPAYSYTITGAMKDLAPPVDFGNLLSDPNMGTGSASTTGAFYEDTGSGGSGRDRFRIRLDENNALYSIQNSLIPVSAGETLWLRAYFFAHTGSSGTSQFGLLCYDVNGAYVTNLAGPTNPSSAGANWILREASVTIPAGVAQVKPYFQRFGGASGGSLNHFYLAEPIISRHQLGADVTAANTAAAIAGQGDLATSNRATLPFGTNLAVNSEFLLVDPTYGGGVIPVGWQAGWTGDSTNVGALTFNTRRVQFQDGSFAFARDVTGAPNGTAMDCVSSYPIGLPLGRFAVPVLPGERIVASALIGHQNCAGAYAVIGFYDENGAYVDEYGGATITRNIGAAAYNTLTRNSLGLVTAAVTVPADGSGGGTGRRRWAVIWLRFSISGSPANPRLVVAAPMLAKVPASQTAIPAYNPGPADRQASFGATTGANLVSPTYGTLSDSGVYTPIGTAAAIAGQAATATNSDYGAVTGTKPPSNATRNDDTANMLEAPLLMDSGFEVIPTAVREFTNTAAGPGRDRYRIRLDSNNALYAIQTRMIPVSAGETLWMRAWFFAGLGTTGTSQFGVECFNTSFGYVTAVGGPQNPASAGAGWFLREAPITIPAGVSFIRPYFQRYGGSGNSYYLAEPAITRHQLGADITGTNTAAAIAGQAATATNSDYGAVTGTKPPSNATNGAPTGTSVGGIPAASVASTINSGGGVAANQVATSAILDNAVTGFAQAGSGSTFTHTAFTSLGSVTLTPVSTATKWLVIISGVVTIGDASPGGTFATVRCGSFSDFSVGLRAAPIPFSLSTVVSGLSAAATLTLQIQASASHGLGDPHTVSSPRIIAIQLTK